MIDAAPQPPWLGVLPKITATGEVWKMRDAYGTRLAVIAGFTYPGGLDPSVFLFDIDACGMATVVNAGVHDDVADAAAAWRRHAGEPAASAEPWSVTTTDDLVCLVQVDQDEMYIGGDESDSVLDNWFRVLRRDVDLGLAWQRGGTPLPPSKSLFGDSDPAPAAAAFTTWRRSHSSAGAASPAPRDPGEPAPPCRTAAGCALPGERRPCPPAQSMGSSKADPARVTVGCAMVHPAGGDGVDGAAGGSWLIRPVWLPHGQQRRLPAAAARPAAQPAA